MSTDKKVFAVQAVIKAIAASIPALSGLGSIYGDTLNRERELRVDNFIQEIQGQLQAHEALINSVFTQSSEFVELLGKTTARIANERSEIKRMAYKNILLTAATSKDTTYDNTETQIRLLDQLNDTHIRLLKFLYNPRKYVDELSFQIQHTNSATNFIKQVFPQWDLEFIRDHLGDLEASRLIEPITGGLMTISNEHGIKRYENVLTKRGRAFLAFVMKD